MPQNKVPNAVVQRLPGYYRYLSTLEEIGLVRISSHELGKRMGLTASQIRQDINCFGGFGQQGYGYNVVELRARIGEILGLTRAYRTIVVGAGKIGQAISNDQSFRDMRFTIEALFDVRADIVGQMVNGLPVYPLSGMKDYLKRNSIDIGVITTPKSAAQSVCDQLIEGNVKAIWNFAPVDLVVPTGVPLRSVHLSDALLVLSYHLTMGE
jgi:redox-sensing transcriptional repressor